MRWSIRNQLLLWMLCVAALGIVLATAAGAYLTVRGASRAQADNLHRVTQTLSQARYPLSQNVLRQMSGLSGGQFVVMDDRHRLLHATIDVDQEETGALREVRRHDPSHMLSAESVIRLGGRQYFSNLVALPEQRSAGRSQYLVVLYPKERWWTLAWQVSFPILAAGAVTMLAVLVLSAVVAGRFVRPIRVLRDQAESSAAGRFEMVDPPHRHDELAELTASINRMTEKLAHYEKEVRQNERLRTLGQLGGGIAHHLRNDATGARMAIELFQRESPEAARAETLEVALRQLRLMESHIQRFLTLGRRSPEIRERFALDHVVDEVLDLVRPACRHAKIELEVTRPEASPLVEGDFSSLCQVLINLVLNAIDAAAPRQEAPARVGIDLVIVEDSRAVLSVTDSGPGPAEAIEGDLFEPFVTDKPEGTGLGLYVARHVAEDHHGTLRWERRKNTTCFILTLPLVESRPGASEKEAT